MGKRLDALKNLLTEKMLWLDRQNLAAAWDLQTSYILSMYNLNSFSVQSIGGDVELGRCSLLSKCSGVYF